MTKKSTLRGVKKSQDHYNIVFSHNVIRYNCDNVNKDLTQAELIRDEVVRLALSKKQHLDPEYIVPTYELIHPDKLASPEGLSLALAIYIRAMAMNNIVLKNLIIQNADQNDLNKIDAAKEAIQEAEKAKSAANEFIKYYHRCENSIQSKKSIQKEDHMSAIRKYHDQLINEAIIATDKKPTNKKVKVGDDPESIDSKNELEEWYKGLEGIATYKLKATTQQPIDLDKKNTITLSEHNIEPYDIDSPPRSPAGSEGSIGSFKGLNDDDMDFGDIIEDLTNEKKDTSAIQQTPKHPSFKN